MVGDHEDQQVNEQTLTVTALESPGELRQVLALARRGAGTLGFLRNEAFTDRLRHRGLVVAKVSSIVCGYILYDLPKKGHIKLVHVYVAPEHRSQGIPKLMLDFVLALNPRATGVYAACRSDYGIDEFWVKLGLVPKRRIPGRAAAGSILIQWWRQLGVMDLFESSIGTQSAPLAVLDTNVVADLFGSSSIFRPTRAESMPLLASWIADSVQYAVSTEVDVENHRNPDQTEAQHRYVGSEHLLRLRTTRPDDRQLEDELLRKLGASAVVSDPSLEHDVLHVSDAIRHEARYFVTHDEALLRHLGPVVARDHGLRIVRPSDLVTELLSPQDRGTFQSAVVQSVGLGWTPASAFDAPSLGQSFSSHVRGESPREVTRTIRALCAQAPNVETNVLTDAAGGILAIVAFASGHSSLTVQLMRVAVGRHARTYALQLTRQLRERAVELRLRSIGVDLAGTDPVTRSALAEDGFVLRANHLAATVLPAVAELREARLWAAQHGYDPELSAVKLERQLWPLLVTETDLPAYIVPIKPRFAESLFGYQHDVLFHHRTQALGLAREHVYYHAAGSVSVPPGPARLLWYVTADQTATARTIAVVSKTVETKSLPADDAHRMFSQMGTLSRNGVRKAANKDGNVHVLRFEESITLAKPLNRPDLRALLHKHKIREPLQSLRRVPSTFFDDVIRHSIGEERPL